MAVQPGFDLTTFVEDARTFGSSGAFNAETLTPGYAEGYSTGYAAGFAAGNPPGTPIITILSPAAGTSITRGSVLTFTVTDTVVLRRVFIYVGYSTGLWEVVHDGTTFSPSFAGVANTRTSIVNGYQYTVLRDGGWQQSPELRILPVDAGGGVP